MPLAPLALTQVDTLTGLQYTRPNQGGNVFPSFRQQPFAPHLGVFMIPEFKQGGGGLQIGMWTFRFDPDAPDGSQFIDYEANIVVDIAAGTGVSYGGIANFTHQSGYSRTYWFPDDNAFVVSTQRHSSGSTHWNLIVRGTYDASGNVTWGPVTLVPASGGAGRGRFFIPLDSTRGIAAGISPENGAYAFRAASIDVAAGTYVNHADVYGETITGAPPNAGAHFNDDVGMGPLGYTPSGPMFRAEMEANGVNFHGYLLTTYGSGVTAVTGMTTTLPPAWDQFGGVNSVIVDQSVAELQPYFSNDGAAFGSPQLVHPDSMSTSGPTFQLVADHNGVASADEFDIQNFQSFGDGSFEVLTRIIPFSGASSSVWIYTRRHFVWETGEELGAWRRSAGQLIDGRATPGNRPQYWWRESGTGVIALLREVTWVPPSLSIPWLRQRQRDDFARAASPGARNHPTSLQASGLRQGFRMKNNYF